MNDLISRQALCEYALNQKDKSVTPNDIMRFPSAKPNLDEWCTDCKEYDSEKNCCPRFNRVIREALKEAQAERPKGKWMPHKEKSREYIGTVLINVEYDYWLCDTCGYRVENGQPMYNFCPNCGADMRGESK